MKNRAVSQRDLLDESDFLKEKIAALELREASYRETAEMYRGLTERSLAGVYIVQDGCFKYLNENASRYAGYSPDELTGFKSYMLVHPDDRKELEATVRAVLHGNYTAPHEFRIIRKDGSTGWILETVTSISFGGRPAILGNSMDITERKKAEEILRANEVRYRTLYETAGDAIFVIKDGLFCECNTKTLKMFSCAKEDILMRPPADFSPLLQPDGTTSQQKSREKIDAALSGKPQFFEWRHSRLDGTTFDTEVSLNVMEVSGENFLLAVVREITERKRLESQLFQAQKMEAIGTLAGGMAHDFNNLLTGIQGYATLVLMDLDPDHPHYEKICSIEEQIRSGAELIKRLLGFAQGGKFEVVPIDLNEVVDNTASLFGRTKKEVMIHREFDDNLFTIEADRSQIEQMLLNLYVNAWQAMPEGGELCLETHNQVLHGKDAECLNLDPGMYVRISVTDTGTGMDDQTKKRVFEPFFTTKGRGRGTGLGLATVYATVKRHGGAIDVQSAPGAGTAFRILFPASEKEIEAAPSGPSEILKGTETILIVDDERAVMNATKEILEVLGYRVFAAGSGQEAVATYLEKKNQVQLVLLDMILPGMSGEATFLQLRDINPDLKIILCSGYSVNEKVRNIMERGCNGFLQKPFDMKILSRKIREVLDSSS
ncbi:MAG: PAS domain S-box protein [Syntrophales bacterium]|nr:PAS domain S-box protein [Syntrophales bacterium]